MISRIALTVAVANEGARAALLEKIQIEDVQAEGPGPDFLTGEVHLSHNGPRAGREDDGPYCDFARAIDQARQDSQANRGRMSRDEFDRHLAQAIRRGSIQAMKLWADLNVGTEDSVPESDEFDQMKARRARV